MFSTILTLLAASLCFALANYCGAHRHLARNSATSAPPQPPPLHARPSPCSGLPCRNQIIASHSAAYRLQSVQSVRLLRCCVDNSCHHVTRPRLQNARLHDQPPVDVIRPLWSAQYGTPCWAGNSSSPPSGWVNPRVPRVGGHWTRGPIILGLSREPSRNLGNAVPLGPAKVVRRDS